MTMPVADSDHGGSLASNGIEKGFFWIVGLLFVSMLFVIGVAGLSSIVGNAPPRIDRTLPAPVLRNDAPAEPVSDLVGDSKP